MIHDAILKTKRDELRNCVTSRKRKLQELYRATVSFAPTELSPKPYQDVKQPGAFSESDFLDANNILEGRFFDAATLRRIPGAELINFDTFNRLQTSKAFELSGRTNGKRDEIYISRSLEPQDELSSLSDGLVNSFQDSLGRNNERAALPENNSKATQATFLSAFEDKPGSSDIAMEDTPASTGGKATERHTEILLLGDSKPELSTTNESEQCSIELSPPVDSSTFNNGLDRPLSIHGSLEDSHAPPSRASSREQSVNIGGSAQNLYMDSVVQLKDGLPDEDPKTSSAFTNPPLASRHASQGPRSFTSQKPPGGGQVDSLEKNLKSSEDTIDRTKFDGLEAHEGDRTSANTSKIVGTGSTPDAQLQFEEAQFLRPSQHLNQQKSYHGNDAPESGQNTIPSPQQSQDALETMLEEEARDRSSNVIGRSRLIDRRKSPSKDRRIPGMMRNMSKDLMFSQRPPMSIDTGVASSQAPSKVYEKSQPHGPADVTTPSSSSTTAKTPQPPAHPSPPERMTTRVSSGALGRKSVSQILNQTPRTASLQGDKTPADKSNYVNRDDGDLYTPKYGPLVSSPDSVQFRSRLSELREREKERSKLSTVVFARQQRPSGDSALQRVSNSAGLSTEARDYLLSLFTAQASAQQPTLNGLLNSAHKTLTTSNHLLDFHEQQDCRILKRIYHLQNSNRWALRQLERSVEPSRPSSHWDVLLGEAKWMRTDFREERKWKLIAAKNLADWCAEWIASPLGRRTFLQVRRGRSTGKIRGTGSHATPVSLQNNGEAVHSDTTPELMPCMEDDMSLSDVMDEGTPGLDVTQNTRPAAIFSLAPEDLVFGLEKTPASDQLLGELSLYQPWEELQGEYQQSKMNNLDKIWLKPIVPVSKLAVEKMVTQKHGPIRRKSRYDYADNDETGHIPSSGMLLMPDQGAEPVQPETEEVALFNPENRHIVDRLHATHAFRPPSDLSMPSQSFFESRLSSQWTWTEDDELRKLVKEYAYNWSLISSCLSSLSLYSSGAERRTPWECFERWVNLEGLPGDMSRTQYFRTWHTRRKAAESLLHQQLVAQQQQQQANGTVQNQPRRRTAEPVRVERRRNSKYFALIHAMQKVAKKKENTIQKQQHVASLAAMRKSNEATQPRQRMQTPQEFSRFKYERELKMQERQETYRQQIVAQQRAALAAKASQQAGQQHAGSGLPQPGRGSVSGPGSGSSPHLTSSLPNNSVPPGHGSQTRPVPPSPVPATGVLPTASQPSGAPNGHRGAVVPQAQMQSLMQGQQRMPPQMGRDNMRVFMEANRVQHEQQQYLAQQRQQQQRYQPNGHNGTSSSPNLPNVSIPSQNNAAMLANLQASTGKLSPAINGTARMSASPRLANVVQAQPLSNGIVLNQISSQLKARHPQASPEQIRQMATESLHQQLRSHNGQAVTQAAANNNSISIQLPSQQGINHSAQVSNAQMYAQYMQAQQAQQSAQQSRATSNGSNGARPPSRGTTPQMRNGNGQGGPSQSPRPPQAQMAGAQ